MDLIKMDDVDIKTPQTRFGPFAYAGGVELAKWRRAAWFTAQAALGATMTSSLRPAMA
jgi:hypothetical protein